MASNVDTEADSGEASATSVSLPSVSATDDIFYRPDRSLYKARSKLVSDTYIASLTAAWPMSESVTSDSAKLGSTLDNKFEWQKKWYQRFVPPKSPEELQIGQYWRYDGPRLEDFMAPQAETDQPESTVLTPTSLSSLKSMAVKVLSGINQESLVANAYQKAVDSRGSAVGGRDGAGSAASSQLRMPESQGGNKRSILAAYNSAKEKENDKTKAKVAKKGQK
ncbi:catalase/peroxidase HPI [Babesia caballi]|uniref:Catalase/peroxidase HPI n=1 Tax=Babesia caballi TaxID=5871 RepID=A0AAV4M159_BABCB|nr:catalase/peroxidase HPI [Babesia caballi]